MRRAELLAGLNGRMLRELSRRTTGGLRAPLPHVERFLATNVDKEVRKDALVIRAAAEALASGSRASGQTVLRLLEESKRIDAAFLNGLGRFPVRIEVPYERVGPLRLRRIELGLDLAHRILGAWQEAGSLRRALPAAYPPQAFERALLEVLMLYGREMEALSHCVRLPALLGALRERLARAVLERVSGAANGLAREVTHALYGKSARSLTRHESAA
jgi:hypothetical protein